MGLLSFVSKAAGAAIGFAVGGPAGAAQGYAVGSTVGSAIDKKKSSGVQTPAAPTSNFASGEWEMARLKKNSPALKGEIKTAKTFNPQTGKTSEEEDPWSTTKQWYDDLGGDSSKVDWNGINI